MNLSSHNNFIIQPDSNVNILIGSFVEIIKYGTRQTEILPADNVLIKSLEDLKKILSQFRLLKLVKIGQNKCYLQET